MNNKNALQGEKIEHPKYIIDNKLKIDYSFYITNQIMNPVQQVFALVLEKIWLKQGKLSKLKNYEKKIKQLKETCNQDELQTEIDKIRNSEIKSLLFDKSLRDSDNNKNNNKSIMKFFK